LSLHSAISPASGTASKANLMPAGAAEGPAAVADVVGVLVAGAGTIAEASGHGLLECFARVEDPRDPRGIRHSLASILGLATAAVSAGQITLVEITAWVAGADQGLLAAMGCRRNGVGLFVAPHADTVERVFAALGAQDLADQVVNGHFSWPWTQVGAHQLKGTNVRPTGAPIGGPVLLEGCRHRILVMSSQDFSVGERSRVLKSVLDG